MKATELKDILSSLIEKFGDAEIMLSIKAFDSDSVYGKVSSIEASEDFLDGDVMFTIMGEE